MGYDKEVNFNLWRVQDREEECLAGVGGTLYNRGYT